MLHAKSDTAFFYFSLSAFKQVAEKARSGSLPAVALFANMARFNALYMITRAGSGHIGSSFSSLDLVSWIYLLGLQSERDIYFSSKGHDIPGLYSVLTALGKIDFGLIHALRRYGGLPGHPDILTDQIPCNTGSLGMGVSKAKGFVFANRLKSDKSQIYVLTGDGELQEGQFWESLQGAVTHRMSEITVIVDHNKLQSDTYVKDTGDLGDLESKFRAFGWNVARCSGHDIVTIDEVLTSFRSEKHRPQVLIADTVKGRGISFMEHTSMAADQTYYKYHSGAPAPDTYRMAAKELYEKIVDQAKGLGVTLEPPIEVASSGGPTGKKERLIPAYSQAILEIAEKHPEIVALDADLVLDTGLIPFKERYSSRFFEFGIAEQDMVSAASAMALKGFLPVVHSFACFLTTRPNEQIYNASSERTKIIYVGSLAGLTPSGPGHSHQSVRDINCMSAMPGLVALEPSCPQAVAGALQWAVEKASGSVYLRLISVPFELGFAWKGVDWQLGQGFKLETPGLKTSKARTVIFSYGPVFLTESIKAASLLNQKGISCTVYDLPWLNLIDFEWFGEVISDFDLVVSIDNHYAIGGQGDRIASAMAEQGLAPSLLRISVDRIPECGLNDEIVKVHQMDSESIARRVLQRLHGSS